MRLLLDESVPHLLANALSGHEVESVQSLGWSGISNGDLLREAGKAGFDALITVDRGFEHEQNIDQLPLTVVILVASSNRIDHLVPLVPTLLETLTQMEPKTLNKVGA